MPQAVEFVFKHIWWTWNPEDRQWFSIVYHWFKLLDLVILLWLRRVVMRRWYPTARVY